MKKLVISIIFLCFSGYLVYVYTDAKKDYEVNELYLDEYYAMCTENNKTITLAVKEKDTSNHQTSSKSITSAYNRIINKKSDKYRIESSLLKAVIKVESNWNSKAVSHAGAMGLMQLMPETAKDLKITNPFNPEDNIDGGARYLRYLLDRFNGNLSYALAAYNAGPTRVKRYRGIPPIKETQQYVKRVLSIYNDEKFMYTAQSLESKT
jgi:soluble lytic murein transglycosylase-like protein